jgi:hypothetical protein
VKTEVEMQGQKIITVVTKDKGWMINPMVGSTEPQDMPAEAVKAGIGRLDVAGEYFNYKEKGATLTLLGKEKVETADAYKIKQVSKDGNESTFFFDATTYYLTRSTFKANFMGQEAEQTVTYSNYKKTENGYIFPYTMLLSTTMGDITANLTKIEVNGIVDAKILDKP